MIGTAAGIVLYNPQIDRLRENIDAVINQCDHVYLADNGSSDRHDIRMLIREFDAAKITVIENEQNLGIARALNQLCLSAEQDGYEWLLTLDQDSVCPPEMIRKYEKYTDKEITGMLCPQIMDRSGGDLINRISDGEICKVSECITSGSMLRLSAWRKIGGFDEYMFIDGVDFDFCHRLTKSGYRILCVGNVVLSHEIGHMEYHRFLLWKIPVLNHKAFRKYYIARNNVYLARKEGTSMLKALLKNVKQLLLIWIYEEDKRTKTGKIIRGTLDGLFKRNMQEMTCI